MPDDTSDTKSEFSALFTQTEGDDVDSISLRKDETKKRKRVNVHKKIVMKKRPAPVHLPVVMPFAELQESMIEEDSED